MSSAQSRANRKYEAKIGMISRSYKLNKELVEEFKAACDRAGVAQSKVLSEAMKKFIEDHPAESEQK